MKVLNDTSLQIDLIDNNEPDTTPSNEVEFKVRPLHSSNKTDVTNHL